MTTPQENAPVPWPPGFAVTVVASTGSTNADLLASAHRLPDRSVLIADAQTAGRGRLDRTWESADPAGDGGPNLLMSILFHQPGGAPHRLTQRVAIAAARACERVAGVSPALKWPNDLLLGDAKLAGILAQAGGAAGGLGHVVVGIGLNVRWAPDGAVCLGAGHRDEVAAALLSELAALPDDHFDEYRQRLATLGRDVRIEMPTETWEGHAVDVDIDGALLVRVGGQLRRVEVGDIVHLRTAG